MDLITFFVLALFGSTVHALNSELAVQVLTSAAVIGIAPVIIPAVLIAGAAGVGLWYWLTHGGGSKALPPAKPTPGGDTPGPTPQAPDAPAGAGPGAGYVGQPGGWDWRSVPLVGGGTAGQRFPTEPSIGTALNGLGYATQVGLPGWSMVRWYAMKVVDRFQRDFNAIRTYALNQGQDFPLPALVPDAIDLGQGRGVGGLMGANTIRALAYAQNLVGDNPGQSWLDLLAEAKAS